MARTYPTMLLGMMREAGWSHADGTVAELTTEERARLDDYLEEAQTRCYFPEVLQPDAVPHVWSFRRKSTSIVMWPSYVVTAGVTVTGVYNAGTGLTTLTLTGGSFYATLEGKTITITDVAGPFVIAGYTSATVITVTGNATCTAKTFAIAGNGNYLLPSGTMAVENAVLHSDRAGRRRITLWDVETVLALRDQGEESGPPRALAIRWQDQATGAAQRMELIAFPEQPDAAYTMQYRALLIPPVMSDANPYPLGGPDFAEMVYLMALAVVEERRQHVRGDRYNTAMARLHSAVRMDQRLLASPTVGKMRGSGSSEDVGASMVPPWENGTIDPDNVLV